MDSPVSVTLDLEVQNSWPPKDPYSNSGPVRPLPQSPWTYGEGVNPNLEASNARLRIGHVERAPYEGNDHVERRSLSSDGTESSDDEPLVRKRRGSEGVEVKMVDREEVLRRYMASRGEEATRYHYYEPESE